MSKHYEGLYDIQKDLITKHFINRANDSDSTLDVSHLSRILEEDKVSEKLGYPFISRPTGIGSRPDRKLDHNSKINIDAFNDTIKTIDTDIKTIRHSIRLMERRIGNMRRSITRISPLFQDAKTKVESKYKELRRQMGLVSFSYRENIQDISRFDIDSSTAFINVDMGTIQASKSSLFAGNIDIGVLTPDTLIAKTADDNLLAIDSRFYHLFVPGAENKTALTIRKENREETGAIIEANLQDLNLTANTVILNTLHKVPTRTTIEIETGGTIKTVVKDEFLIDSVYTFSFDPKKVDKIIIYMWQKIESAVDENNLFKYDYILNHVSLEYVNFNSDALFVTQPISTSFAITDIMMEAVDQRPAGTNIKYYVSKDSERWIPITPRNLVPDAPNSLVSLSLSSVEVLDEIGDDDISWALISPITSYGPVILYNLLEKSSSQYVEQVNKTLSIINDSDDEIIEDSIKLYRGSNDWSIETENYETINEYSDIEYRFPSYQLPSGQVDGELLYPDSDDYTYDKISITSFVRIENEIHTIDNIGGDRQIKTIYPIHNNNIQIIDPKLARIIDLKDTATPIDYVAGTVKLDANDAVVGNEVLVTYNVAIESIESKDNVSIQIDPETIKYKTSEDTTVEPEFGEELFYSIYDKRMHIRKENNLPANAAEWVTAYISFKTIQKTKDTYKVFKTYVYYGQDTEITILPFTQEEISFGNKHVIDNIDVSTLKTYTMVGGWHEVVTTQPYKSKPGNNLDVNILTNKKSNAGIILGDYVERRAYKNSMRKVSTHALSNIIAPGDHRSFAYDNGKILLNFIPEQLPEGTLTIAPQLTGDQVLCKEALYLSDGKYTFDEYIEKREQFTIEYKTRPKDINNELKTLYVKGELYVNQKLGISPAVFQFDVLFL